MNSFSDKVLILGLGKSGKAVAQFLLSHTAATVYGVDNSQALFQNDSVIDNLIAQGAKLSHESQVVDVTAFDLLVASPGISQQHPLILQAKQRGIKVTGEIALACHFLKGRRLIGITGTNGKTTVTLLVTHILNQSGVVAKAAGNVCDSLNVGTPLISEINNSLDEVLVVELSSYQLETLDEQILEAAVLLNVTPDHLERYASMDNYAAAKLGIISSLTPDGVCYIEEKTIKQYGHLMLGMRKPKSYGFSPECNLYTDGEHLFMEQRQLFRLPPPYCNKKSHDVENLLAAYALCHRMGISAEQFVVGLSTFTKPPHRIQYVREKSGVTFIDDSKGTNIDAVIKAVDALRAETPQAGISLIAGGVDKGAAYLPWLEVLKKGSDRIYAIGQAAEKIRGDLGHKLPVELCATLEEAVKKAADQAKRGDYVLLSPGCSSFDMFRDYAHRGQEFQRIVKQL